MHAQLRACNSNCAAPPSGNVGHPQMYLWLNTDMCVYVRACVCACTLLQPASFNRRLLQTTENYRRLPHTAATTATADNHIPPRTTSACRRLLQTTTDQRRLPQITAYSSILPLPQTTADYNWLPKSTANYCGLLQTKEDCQMASTMCF